MKNLRLTILLFTIIVLEGYVVLSSELLAIRQTIPFVGSGTDTISIIIAAVLMPLAFGYQNGGQFQPGVYNGRFVTIRTKLIKNLIISQIILLIGLSHTTLNFFFSTLMGEGLTNNLIMAATYATIFLVTPVYLLGQTIPLISNYFSKEHLSAITGKILFFSTFGSFIGAVFSTLVLMSTIGVHYTAAINFIILALLITALSKKKTSDVVMLSWAIVAIGIAINATPLMRSFGVVESNQYNTVMIKKRADKTYMILNNNSSSMISDSGKRHAYVEFIEKIAIRPIWQASPPKKILIIGAGGFTMGYPDHNNHYDFIDIDASLKDIAETHLHKEKLSANKHFHASPARSFLSQAKTKYDLIILDAYLGNISIPEQLATQEFFTQVRDALNDNGVVIANFVQSASFKNALTRNIDNTFRSVFPHTSRHIINDRYKLWNEENGNDANVIYIFKDNGDIAPSHIYTDNKNTVFKDKPKNRYAPKNHGKDASKSKKPNPSNPQ